MNSRERMCKVLNHEIPDRVPTFEYGIDKKVVEAICPAGTYADVVEALDLDAITAIEPSQKRPGDGNGLKPGETFVDEWGVKHRASVEMTAYPLEEDVPIRNESDLKNYTPPDPNLESRYAVLREYVKRFRGERLISYANNDMFELSKYLMGTQEFLIAFVERPHLIKKLLEMTTDWVIQVANRAIDIGADMIIDRSDLGFKTGTLVPPEAIQELFVPCLKRVVDAVKKRRAYIFYHCHGNIWTILDMLIGTGIDVIHPLAREETMDIGIVKKIFGTKVVVAGNISTDFLSRTSRAEVIDLVKETISNTSGRGGHILMAASSILSSVNPDNYRAMVETVHTYGKYS